MRILILGGTVFLGRALVEAARTLGHTVTLFNRGKSNPELFPDVEKLYGDRARDLSPLQGRRWDAVIDTSGYVPRIVRSSAELLSGAVGHYTFISSLFVYADTSQPGIDERGSLAKMEDETVEEVNGETYAPLKVLCERAVERALPGRALILRPGLIVGPHDPTDRFTYWAHRVAQGGEVLAPGRPGRLVQFIDVRDLAEWNIRMLEEGRTGTYNANGPVPQPSMEALLHTSREASGSDAHFAWVGEAFLLEQNVAPWMEMPLWVPESDPENAGFFAFDSSKAVHAGLTFRPLEETIADTLTWAASRPPDHAWRAGISREREMELLEEWRRERRTTKVE
jgi:2'-hydroxyisoflavone reductase